VSKPAASSVSARVVKFAVCAIIVCVANAPGSAQELLSADSYRLIKSQVSGELPFSDFRNIVRYSGFAPSPGSDQVAEYLAGRLRQMGLANVDIEKFPADGKAYSWAFRTEPSWEGKEAELWMVKPESELLSSFASAKTYLARQSNDADVTAELVDVGEGVKPEDYAGKNVEGRLVLATGNVNAVNRQAVWERKAAGIIYFRTANAADYPDLFGTLEFAPWTGSRGEKVPFAFSLSNRVGSNLRARLAAGEQIVLKAHVKVESGAGNYSVVRGEIPGSDPKLPAVLVYAHDNSRNSGGANNLTGVGCNLEVAHVLSSLIESGNLPRPRRTIRFMFGPEHYGITEHVRNHPDDVANILAMINVDMIGYSQSRARAVLHLYRTPWSHPSFLNDIVQEFVERVGEENTISIRNAHFISARPTEGFLEPLFAPTGSQDQLRYNIEEFWGPSDHEDAVEGSVGLAAILLNDFPDVYLGTQDDRPELAGDPTQMRRGVAIVASSAYATAAASEANAAAVTHNQVTKAEARLAKDSARAFAMVDSADAGKQASALREAGNLIHQAYAREAAALASLQDIVGKQAFQAVAIPVLTDWKSDEQKNMTRLKAATKAGAANTAGEASLSATAKSAALIPARNPEIRGPVNFFRIEYGRWWLIEKTGDEHFEQKVPLAQKGHYMLFEALSLANGKRRIGDIRDIISAEYEPVSVEDVAQYFRFMESLGVVQLK
jgi:aminopeptidase YwaD